MSAYRKFIDSATPGRQHSRAAPCFALHGRGQPLVKNQHQRVTFDLPAAGPAMGPQETSPRQRPTYEQPAAGLASKHQFQISVGQPAAWCRTCCSDTAAHCERQQQLQRGPADSFSTMNNNNNNNVSIVNIANPRKPSRPHRDESQPEKVEARRTGRLRLESLLEGDDPVMVNWLRAMRFETELECLSALQARTLAIDEHSAGALSVRNSQVTIQEIRLESSFNLDFVDHLIDSLPLDAHSVDRFAVELSELWRRLADQTRAQLTSARPTRSTTTTAGGPTSALKPSTSANYLQVQHGSDSPTGRQQQLTIINCTPRKSVVSARTARPLDKLAEQIRAICLDLATGLHRHQEHLAAANTRPASQRCHRPSSAGGEQPPGGPIDSGQLEAQLRRLKELYGRFVEISLRAECANIVRALDYDFSQSSLSRMSSCASLLPVRPFESSSSQLPLKWALIALWQLTRDDTYICRTLTERWQTGESGRQQPEAEASPAHDPLGAENRSRVAKRLDYSTKHHQDLGETTKPRPGQPQHQNQHNLRSDYEKLYQICQNDLEFKRKQQSLGARPQGSLKSGQLGQPRQVSTIELLIGIIISQPNKHERLDMMNLMRSQTRDSQLIDVDELDQSVSAAIYTSNQYKVAALRILNHLCVNEQAVKTILRCFSTPPAKLGQLSPENKIIRSIFECYQTVQEHIYQNETMLNQCRYQYHSSTSFRKRARAGTEPDEEWSDYSSQLTGASNPTASSASMTGTSRPGPAELQLDDIDQGDDVVVKEAIRLLIQLTSYFHRSNQGHDYYTLIGRISIEALVKYLTNIIRSTGAREMLLLSLSLLANISFITTDPMRMHETTRVILEMFRMSRQRSKDLELRDQAVTILANTVDKNLPDIVNNGGLTFLLACLESCPTRMSNYKRVNGRIGPSVSGQACIANQVIYANQHTMRQASAQHHPRPVADANGTTDDHDQDDAYGGSSSSHCRPSGLPNTQAHLENVPRDRKPVDLSDEFLDHLDCDCDQLAPVKPQSISLCLSRLGPGELAAMERIHQKTAVAFARMSTDPISAQLVAEHGGVKKLIDLCKLSHKRNHSDTVLIACIAALRKMSKVIDREVFRRNNALDLIDLEVSYTMSIYGNVQGLVRQPAQAQQPVTSTPICGQPAGRLYASDV